MGLLAVMADILLVGSGLLGGAVPDMATQAARHHGRAAIYSAMTLDGAPLRLLAPGSDQPEAAEAARGWADGRLDALVLAEAAPVADHLAANDTAGAVLGLADAALEVAPTTRTFLFETWPPPPAAGDAGAAAAWRAGIAAELPLWQGVVDHVNARRATGVPMRLVPAAQVLAALDGAAAGGGVPGLAGAADLFDAAGRPNDRGRYLITLVLHAALLDDNPQGLPARLVRRWESRDGAVGAAMAEAMQAVVWQTLRGFRPPPGIPPPEPAAEAVAASAPGPAPPDVTGIENDNLGFGLAGVYDWTAQQPFLDVFRTARAWTGHLPGQWGGWGHDELAAGGWLDAQGWPRAVPPELTGIATLVLTDLPEDAALAAGRYRMTWAGEGELTIEGRASVVERGPGHALFDFTPGQGGVILTIRSTDPSGRGDPIRDIRIVRADRAALLEAGAVFNPDWIERIRGVRLVRFMDWMATNDSRLARLADRPRPGDYTWARNGVPMEVMVAMANELGADAWFTLPHLAEDDLVRAYAGMARDGLGPGLRAWVEFSNEVWNWQFQQAAWAHAEAQRRWGSDRAWVQFYSVRAAEVAAIWAEEFGAAAADRLVRVIGVQTGWIGLEPDILDAPLWQAEAPGVNRPPAEAFDAYAVTGYFSGGLGSPGKAAMLRGWLEESRAAAEAEADRQRLTGTARERHVARHRFDLATRRAAAELRDGGVSGQAEDSLAHLLGEVLPHHAAVARTRGLELVMYEGGTHVVGLGELTADEALTAFFVHLNYSPEMGALYAELLSGWQALTPAPFNAFTDVQAPSRWGSWGALRHLGDDNPRWRALAAPQ